MLITDAVWTLVQVGGEVALGATGAGKKEQLAFRATVAAGAAASMATLSATSAAVQALDTSSQMAMDAAGVDDNSPIRRAMSNALKATATITSGQGSVSSFVQSGIQLGAEVAEEAEIEGLEQLAAAANIIAIQDGALDLQATLARSGGAALGGGSAAALGARNGQSHEELFETTAIGLNLGIQTTESTSSLVSDGGTSIGSLLIDSGVQAGTSLAIMERAKATGDADAQRAIQLGQNVRISSTTEVFVSQNSNADEATPTSHLRNIGGPTEPTKRSTLNLTQNTRRTSQAAIQDVRSLSEAFAYTEQQAKTDKLNRLGVFSRQDGAKTRGQAAVQMSMRPLLEELNRS